MSPISAEEDLTRVHKSLIDARPQNANTTPAVLPLRERFVGGYQSAAVVSGLAVGVLALACATIAALALVTTVASGLLPAATMSRTEPMSVLRRTHTGATAGRGPRRVLYALSGVQVALATTLLVSCGILVLQAYARVQAVDLGFRPAHVLAYRVRLPIASYPDDASQLAFHERLLGATQAIPGVDTAALVTSPLFVGGGNSSFYEAEGVPPPPQRDENPIAFQVIAEEGYFEALAVAVLSGRTFNGRDGRDPDTRVAIVNESFADQFFGDDDVVERRIRVTHADGRENDNPWLTIVGVTGDVVRFGAEEERGPAGFLPFRQVPVPWLGGVVRTSLDPASLSGEIRRTVAALDPMLAVYEVRTMVAAVEESYWVRRAYSTLLTAFAVTALVLALSGVYGVVAHTAARRTRERSGFAWRSALSARTSCRPSSVEG